MPISKNKLDRAIGNGHVVCDSESVTRTSARSRTIAEMRMRKEKSAIYPQRVIRSTLCLLRYKVFGVGGSNDAISD